MMENSILEDLIFGDYIVEDTIKPNKRYLKISEKCSKLYDDLKKNLSEEQAEKLDNFINENTGCEYENSVAHFKAGFKLAFKIAVECFFGEDN